MKSNFINKRRLDDIMDTTISDWQRQAEADFETAKFNSKGKKYYAAVIFAQQAAEKGLKAVFISKHGKIAPKIHDIVGLCRLVSAPQNLLNSAQLLTISYFVSRYPGIEEKIPLDLYDSDKTQRYIKAAEEILQWCRKNL